MLNSTKIKKYARNLGADLCGIAPVERFRDAPPGFHPKDILDMVESVIVFAKRIPVGTLNSKSPVPYTFAGDVILEEVFKITVDLANWLDGFNLIAVPVPSEPYEYWDKEQMEGRGILSLKHAGFLAGLGVMGKNTLLCNARYGNMITLGAVLVNQSFTADKIVENHFCNEQCRLCVQNCPAGALDGVRVNQKLCRTNSQIVTEKGYFLYTCNQCRKICPNHKGSIK